MSPGVNRRVRQVERTEERVLAAATGLFLANGYVATTLAAVAEAADVGARTVYVRFGTKAELLKRVVDVAIVGDTLPVDVLGREWFAIATSAPMLAERIDATAAGARGIMERASGVLAVAQEAAATEPMIAEQWVAGREATRRTFRMVLTKAVEDGMMDGAKLDWIVDTAAVIGAAETYLLATRMLHFDLDTYEAWLRDMLTMLTRT
ncbi:MAG TPA: helix-turn-helix domain-containing protein [Pseudonocardiaceae bacterium]|jgi:AcrR family transcriptional regulator|nr:helix-turn-helix domain-containing protein [Pseudonocardiaceae bacterium]